jgi:hypothetical protein
MPPPWSNSSARKRFIVCPGWMISQRMAPDGTVHVCILNIMAIKDDEATSIAPHTHGIDFSLWQQKRARSSRSRASKRIACSLLES